MNRGYYTTTGLYYTFLQFSLSVDFNCYSRNNGERVTYINLALFEDTTSIALHVSFILIFYVFFIFCIFFNFIAIGYCFRIFISGINIFVDLSLQFLFPLFLLGNIFLPLFILIVFFGQFSILSCLLCVLN